MGMSWLSRSVSFAESIAIGPKTCWSQRAYASRSPLIVADMQINVHHPIRMIATAVGVAGFPSQLSEGGGNHPAQDFNP
jgi:hypothetical protein